MHSKRSQSIRSKLYSQQLSRHDSTVLNALYFLSSLKSVKTHSQTQSPRNIWGTIEHKVTCEWAGWGRKKLGNIRGLAFTLFQGSIQLEAYTAKIETRLTILKEILNINLQYFKFKKWMLRETITILAIFYLNKVLKIKN